MNTGSPLVVHSEDDLDGSISVSEISVAQVHIRSHSMSVSEISVAQVHIRSHSR